MKTIITTCPSRLYHSLIATLTNFDAGAPLGFIELLKKFAFNASTLLKIIRGYYQVSNGNIYINNIEFNFYGKNVIGNKITYISQNEIIFDLSLLHVISKTGPVDMIPLLHKLCQKRLPGRIQNF